MCVSVLIPVPYILLDACKIKKNDLRAARIKTKTKLSCNLNEANRKILCLTN